MRQAENPVVVAAVRTAVAVVFARQANPGDMLHPGVSERLNEELGAFLPEALNDGANMPAIFRVEVSANDMLTVVMTDDSEIEVAVPGL